MPRITFVCVLALCLVGCVATERVRFTARNGQTALNRDGRPAVSSVGKDSIVLLSAGREAKPGQRVGFVVAIQSRSKAPVNFNVAEVEAVQSFGEGTNSQPLEVLTYEKLQQEERTRQVVNALIVGVAAGANAAAASQAGRYNSTTTIYTPRGTLTATTSGYDHGMAAIASANAATQNAQMIDGAIAQGQANLARLEAEYVKDHTLLPGEWYGGSVSIAPPVGDASTPKRYQIQIRVGGDTHSFDAMQEAPKT